MNDNYYFIVLFTGNKKSYLYHTLDSRNR